ncbi:MAG: AraC family transcriptional regulator [Burkholderiales bacterium]|nr:AraC family transcriptional regulator [Burkholderiales bacterium]
MDALSDALRGFRFSGAIFLDAELTRPWAVVTPSSADIADALAVRADHVIPYHLVTEGECTVTIPGQAPVRLTGGEIVMIPHGNVHTLASQVDVPPIQLPREFVDSVLKRRSILPIRHGGGGGTTRMLCGFFAVDRWYAQHLVKGLPPLVSAHVGSDGGQQLLAAVARRSIEESKAGGPGSDALVCRLSEVLFLDALRLIVKDAQVPVMGWLAGLRDPHIRHALSLIHARSQQQWSIQTLANDCGMSRSSFVEKFSALIGSPPMKYLAQWRMTLAARDLSERDTTVMEVADRYGYSSEASFTRAFRRAFNIPPATFRRSQLRNRDQ